MKSLEPASWDLVPQISEKLVANGLDSKSCYNTLNNLLYLKKKFDFNCLLLTPGGVLDEYATYAILTPTHDGGVHIHTLSDDPKELDDFAAALASCKYIDWQKPVEISCLHERSHRILVDLEKIFPDHYRYDCYVRSFHILKEDALALPLSIPEDVDVRTVTLEHAELINNTWPHGNTPESLIEVIDAIKFRDSVGLFNKKTNELMAWCLYGEFGGPALLYVSDSHRRKGYGEIALISMTKLSTQKGDDPHAYIVPKNVASQTLFRKVGYKEEYEATWAHYVPPQK